MEFLLVFGFLLKYGTVLCSREFGCEFCVVHPRIKNLLTAAAKTWVSCRVTNSQIHCLNSSVHRLTSQVFYPVHTNDVVKIYGKFRDEKSWLLLSQFSEGCVSTAQSSYLNAMEILFQVWCRQKAVSMEGNHSSAACRWGMEREEELEKSLLPKLCTGGPLAARCVPLTQRRACSRLFKWKK